MREALTDVQKCEWDEADLIRRLCHALDIAQQAVARLAPNGYTDAEDLLINVRPEKVISETAVLLLAASAVARVDEVRMRIDQVARLLIPHARSERMRLGTCLEPALALDYSAAHPMDAGFEESMRSMWKSPLTKALYTTDPDLAATLNAGLTAVIPLTPVCTLVIWETALSRRLRR